MTYDEFKVVVAKVIEIEYDHWLKHGTPIRKEDAVLVADDVAGEVFIDSAVELARLRAEIDRLRGVLKTIAAYRLDDFAGPCTMAMQCVQDAKDALGGAADQPSAVRTSDDDADDLLRRLGLDPERYRTEGGWLNIPKIVAAIKHPDLYPRMTADNGTAVKRTAGPT